MTTQIQKPKNDIRSLLSGENIRKQIALALPKHLTGERFLRIVMTTFNRIPKLAECTPESFFGCLLTCAQLGIEPDGRRAHLIPFNNRKKGVVECQLIIDYKGLVELAKRSGDVTKIHADVVCENDEFEYDRGEIKRHAINFHADRGAVYAVYALAKLKDGSEQCEVMSVSEVEAIRKRSRSSEDGPWVTDWNEMAKKTAFRRLSKWLVLSPEYRDALDADDDQLEQKRFDAAKPVFANTPPLLETPSEPANLEAQQTPEPEKVEAGQ